MIHVITGPQCGGKTTYVAENRADGDPVIDFDAIAYAMGGETRLASAARLAAIGKLLEKPPERDSWLIHCNPDGAWRARYADAGAEIVCIDPGIEECLRRCEADGRPEWTEQAIRRWYAHNASEPAEAPKGAFFMPAKGGAMSIKTKTVDVKSEGNGSITGYAATFTREPDSYGDVVAKGAFAESIERIKAEGKAIPLLWNHDSGDLKSYIGTVTELAEDDHGLLFTATFDATERAQRARELASDGRLCKFSFAYNVLDQGTVTLEDGTEANELRKLDLFEVSLVMYPANPDTSVVEVKASGIKVVGRAPADDAIAKSIEDATGLVVREIGCKVTHDALPELTITAVAPYGFKAGRRNSAKDADDLNRIKELCGSIQSIVNGLLADVREEPDEQEPDAEDDGAKANAEEPDGANAEEPEADAAEVEALLKEASELLTKKKEG